MQNINGRKQWSPVRLLETHELARGGINGNLNEQAQALADRTELLKSSTPIPFNSDESYNINQPILLNNGLVVRSTIQDNNVDPNQDMTNWILDNTTTKTFLLNPLNISISRSLDEKLNGELASIKDGGAIGDGSLHTLQEWIDSRKFSSLEAIKIAYPSATALTDSIDTVVIQTWLDIYKRVLVPFGKYVTNKTIKFIGSGKELYSECVSTYGVGDLVRTNIIHEFNGDIFEVNQFSETGKGRHRIRGIAFTSNNDFSGCVISNNSSQNHYIENSFYNFKDGVLKINGRSYGTYICRNSFDRNGSNGKYDIIIDSAISATDYNTITVITDNIVETSYKGFIDLKDSDPFYISGNYVEPFGSTSAEAMINIKNSSSGNTKGWVYKNYMGSINGNGLAISAVGSNLFVEENIITDFKDGIYFASQNGSCQTNQVKGYTGFGIRDASTVANVNNNSVVLGNILQSKSTGAVHGILSANSTNGGIIASNIIRGKHDYYIRLLSAFNKFVEGNTLLPLAGGELSGVGIYEDDNCTGNTVRNNAIQTATKYRRYSFDYDEFYLPSTLSPASGIWKKGQIVKVIDPIAFGALGYIATADGTGAGATWKKYGILMQQAVGLTSSSTTSEIVAALKSANLAL